MKKEKPLVVLVDDDAFWARGTMLALDERFTVTYLRSINEARDFFDDRYDIDGIILDVMMPAPDGVEGETHEGFLTGVWFLGKIQELVIKARIAVLVLSNHHDMPTVEKKVAEIGIPSSLVTIQTKFGTKRRDLAALFEARILAAKSLSK